MPRCTCRASVQVRRPFLSRSPSLSPSLSIICLSRACLFVSFFLPLHSLPLSRASGTPGFNWYATERMIRRCLVAKNIPTYVYYFKRQGGGGGSQGLSKGASGCVHVCVCVRAFLAAFPGIRICILRVCVCVCVSFSHMFPAIAAPSVAQARMFHPHALPPQLPPLLLLPLPLPLVLLPPPLLLSLPLLLLPPSYHITHDRRLLVLLLPPPPFLRLLLIISPLLKKILSFWKVYVLCYSK